MNKPLDRFWSKAVIGGPEDCWIWTSTIWRNGYGGFWLNGKTVSAHRLAYELTIGPIPDGLTIDHLCRTRCCVNPAHMEPVTRGENGRRGRGAEIARAKKLALTRCKNGHEYTESNTYIEPKGTRVCKTCRRVTQARYMEKVAAHA